ncbi:MAG: EamA family transporter [Candidatus Binatia bacterium]
MSSAEEHKRDSSTFNRGRLLILFTGVLWSLGGVFIKSLELPPVVIAFYRSIFASLLFSLFVTRSGWRLGVPLLVSVASYTATMSFFVWANKLTTAANAIVLQYTAPIFVFLFIRLWFHEPISRSNLLTLFLGMVGVTIIFSESRGQQDLQGVTVALFSGIVFSIYMVNLRFLKGINPLALTFVNNLVCSLALLPLAVTQLALSTDQILALAAMGVVQLGIPYFLFSKGLETISLQEASLIVLVEPVLNPVWVVLIVGEVPSGATLVGGGVILFSLALRYLRLLIRREGHTE